MIYSIVTATKLNGRKTKARALRRAQLALYDCFEIEDLQVHGKFQSRIELYFAVIKLVEDSYHIYEHDDSSEQAISDIAQMNFPRMLAFFLSQCP